MISRMILILPGAIPKAGRWFNFAVIRRHELITNALPIICLLNQTFTCKHTRCEWCFRFDVQLKVGNRSFFDCNQHRVIHERLSLEKLHIFAHGPDQLSACPDVQRCQLFVALLRDQKVNVLQRRRLFRFALNHTIDCATFQVENVSQLIGILQSDGVFH